MKSFLLNTNKSHRDFARILAVLVNTIDIELHPDHNKDSEIHQIYALLKKLKVDVRNTSIFNESVNEGISVFDERHFGKKGIIIMIDDNGKKVSAIFKDKKNADKFNRNNPSDIKKLLQLAKNTPYPKAIDESVNEGKKRFKRQDGIGKAKYTISFHDGKKKHKDGSDFFDIKIFKNKKDLSDFVGTLVKQGYKLTRESVNEDKSEIKGLVKKVGKSETKFYDILSTIEKKLGKRKYRIWLEKSLKDFGENPKHYDYRTNASVEEKLFQVSK